MRGGKCALRKSNFIYKHCIYTANDNTFHLGRGKIVGRFRSKEGINK